jgi:hypothetical protein
MSTWGLTVGFLAGKFGKIGKTSFVEARLSTIEALATDW